MKIRETIKIIWKFAIWSLSILLLLAGLLFVFIHPTSSIFLILAGLIAFPPFWKLIDRKIKFKVPNWAKAVVFIALSIAWLEAIPPSTSSPKVINQSVSPTPTIQARPTKQQPVENKAADGDKTAKETSFDPKQYEDTAKTYCSQRKATARVYPILKLEEGADGKAELKPSANKQGKNLTPEDCLSFITALVFTNKQGRVIDIANGKYWIGMDFFEIGYSLGIPDDRTTRTEQGWLGTKETEVLTYYGSGGYKLYLHLENKILTKWTEDY